MPTIRIHKQDVHVRDVPDECPRCHKSILAINVDCGIEVNVGAYDYLQAIFRCPACKLLFFGLYRQEQQGWKFQLVEPKTSIKISFDLIDGLSPEFSKIFNQAATAEDRQLDEIAGLGYRKALEFLVKDYCISQNPKESEAIKAEFLGAVIKNRVPNKKIQMAAERAAWLGNDESHYVRVWVDHDIQDLKNLIKITVSGISESLQFDAYMSSFEKKPNASEEDSAGTK